MTATWMLYCIALSLLFGVGAAALERALHAFGRPVRWAWAGAVLLSLALPPALYYAPRAAPLPPVGVEAAPGVGEMVMEAAPAAGAGAAERLVETLDALLLPGWAAATLLLILAFGVAAVRMHLRRRGWRRGRVAGVPVRISARTGPAVVGWAPGEIVLPGWALSLEEERRRLIVEHEREHLRARDPALLLAALLAVALTPWNAALWWQLRRLRLATEVDCDARVLRRRPDVRGYGLLLLDVGRFASTGRLAVAALSEPRSFLERRIRMMTTRPRRTLRPVALAVLVCAAAVLSAAALPFPDQPRLRLPSAGEPSAAPAPVLHDTVYDVAEVEEKPKLQNPAEVQQVLVELYPPLLRSAGVTGSAEVRFVVGREGSTGAVEVLSASDPAFAEPSREAIRKARFRPARHEGRAVPVRVTMPITFILDGEPPTQPSRARVGVGEPVLDVSEATGKPRLRNAAEVQALLVEHYPPLLRDAGITGTALVTLTVSEEGKVTEARVREAGHEAFGAAAAAVARRMEFTPATKDGKPVAVRVTIPMTFSLEKEGA